jgi:hypothetical protein
VLSAPTVNELGLAVPWLGSYFHALPEKHIVAVAARIGPHHSVVVGRFGQDISVMNLVCDLIFCRPARCNKALAISGTPDVLPTLVGTIRDILAVAGAIVVSCHSSITDAAIAHTVPSSRRLSPCHLRSVWWHCPRRGTTPGGSPRYTAGLRIAP